MAVDINLVSARVFADAPGAVPAVSVGRQHASVHLTQGFMSPDNDPNQNKPALTITGEVNVLADNLAEANDVLSGRWKFNFIQIMRARREQWTYLGRRDGEGEIFMLVLSPPAWPTNRVTSLDSAASTSPFVNRDFHVGVRKRQQPGQRITVEIKHVMTDHPNTRIGLTMHNNETKALNFLFSIEQEYEFFSVFTARSDVGALHPLAHIKWKVSYDARFRWARNRPTGNLRSASFGFFPAAQGPPPDADIRAIFNNPVPPFSNDVVHAAIINGLNNTHNKQESKRRSLLVPKDFFL
jgi:hypothetical protein